MHHRASAELHVLKDMLTTVAPGEVVAQLVVLLKDTSLAYIVGYTELLRTGTNLTNFFGNDYAFSFFFIVLAMYLTMNLLLSRAARIVARRTSSQAPTMSRRRRKALAKAH